MAEIGAGRFFRGLQVGRTLGVRPGGAVLLGPAGLAVRRVMRLCRSGGPGALRVVQLLVPVDGEPRTPGSRIPAIRASPGPPVRGRRPWSAGPVPHTRPCASPGRGPVRWSGRAARASLPTTLSHRASEHR